MFIESVSLKNFRNIENLKLKFCDGVNILYGNNAQGKTNILEAIYMCSTGRSHRTHSDRDLINFKQKDLFVKLVVNNDGRTNIIDVYLKKDEKKGIAINNIPIKKLAELFGVLYTVTFSPEDLEIIKMGPSVRRKFIDLQLCQLSNVYCYNLQQYYKVLKQRNNLLKKIMKIRHNSDYIDTLSVWDSQLTELGVKIIKERTDFIKKIDVIAKSKHNIITGGTEDFKVSYSPNCTASDFTTRISKNIDRDIFYGTTTAGPHKDDINFVINGNDVRIFGSQGQQRCAALSIKISEIDLIINETGTSPVLLLDDVFSELDELRAKFLLSNINNIQIIFTCTGIENVLYEYISEIESSNIYNIEDGKVINSTFTI